MSKPLITVLTVNYNTSDFIKLMLYSLQTLTKNSYKVIICDNGSTNKEILKLVNIVRQYKNIEIIIRKQSIAGSIGHAEAMDLLSSMVDTEYFVTIDSDATFLIKNWDELLLSKINDNVKVVGTTLPPTSEKIKPTDFPLVFAVLYESKAFKKIKPSFMPSSDEDKAKDTGWEIRLRYLQKGFSGFCFRSENTRMKQNTVFGSLICALYFIDNVLVCSHFGRGASGYGKYQNNLLFSIPKVSLLFRKQLSYKQKEEWIKKCYEIINRQLVE